ncbi:MAG: hypothetical protein SFW36_16225, partial [Leptolyngbyaceae cyanobacterium bins.59]|nr:hypothetical protein [Leptolyngbyaceae cyanobacterium bins.59]
MSHKTYTAELPKELLDFAVAYSALQGEDRGYALDVIQTEPSQTKRNQLLQARGYNKRQANSLLKDIQGKLDSAIECRQRHIDTLEGKIKSAKRQIERWTTQLSKYPYPCCDIRRNQWRTTQHRLRFNIHHKRRYLIAQQRKLEVLQCNSTSVNLGPVNNFTFVGSQGESWGNQICQYDGTTIKIRLPERLEPVFNGKYVQAPLTFPYGQGAIRAALIRRAINRNSGEVIPAGKGEALTWRIYQKRDRWYIAVTLDVTEVPTQSKPVQYGCIGVDFNPGVIGWCYVSSDGHPVAKGQFKVSLHSRRTGQVKAALADIAVKLVAISERYCCPIVVERLDFSAKKKRMREEGRRYARMLNYFAYSTWHEVLATRCLNRGTTLIQVNPAYSSLIGLTKFMRRFGMSSDTAAALALARRAMKLSESVPAQVASLVVRTRKHVWASWYRLNRKLKGIPRHHFYQPRLTASLSNYPSGLVANAPWDDQMGSGNSVQKSG